MNPPYTPMTETVPPFRQDMIAWRKRDWPVCFQHHGLFCAVISAENTGRVCLHADSVDAGVRSSASGHFFQRVAHVDFFVVERLRAYLLTGHAEPLRKTINGYDTLRPQQESALHCKLADGAAAPDRNRVAGLNIAHLRAHVARWEDIGEKEDLIVLNPSGTLIGPTSAKGTRAYSA